MSRCRVLLCGQDPSRPGGMAQYVGMLMRVPPEALGADLSFLDETEAKNRSGMGRSRPWQVAAESGRFLGMLARRIRTDRPDMVHLHMAYGMSILEKMAAARLANRHGIPAILHLHGSRADVEIPRWGTMRRRLAGRIMAAPNHVVVLTRRMEDTLRSTVPGARITVIPNAVTPILPVPPLPDGPPTLGMIGHLDGRKGECDLIRAVAAADVPSLRVLIAGGGPGLQEAQDLAVRLGVGDRVEFLGVVAGGEKDRFFRRTHLICLPSRAENLPIALLEGMSYGRPVIATAVGGVPDLVREGENGWLVPPLAPDHLARAIENAFGVRADLQSLGSAASREISARYSWDVVAAHLGRLYHSYPIK
jgi:glycosyltransferase involved in cell wall biosynthesis